MPARSSGGEDVPGIDQHQTPEVAGFDIGWAPSWSGDLQTPVDAAQAFAADLRGKVFGAGLTDVMGAAGFTSYLSGKLREQLAEPLRATQSQLLDYQSRLSADLVQPVMDAVTFGRPFGLYPDFEPGVPLPTDVMETRASTGILPLANTTNPAGAQWVLDPKGLESAVQDFRFSCLPLRFTDPEQYSRCLQAIEDRFPEGSTWLPEFRRRVSLLEETTSPQSGSVVKAVPAPPGGLLPGIPPGLTGQQPGGCDQPDRLPQDGDVVRAGSGAGLPAGYFQLPFSPGLYVPCWWWDPKCPGEIRFPRPPGLTDGPNHFWKYVGNYPNGRWCKYEGAPLLGCGSSAVLDAISRGAQLVGECAPQGQPTTPGIGEPIPRVPETPPTSEVPCVKICGLEEFLDELKKTQKPAECRKWKAWRDASNGECYVQPADKEPRNSLDKFLLESTDCGALIAAVNKECGEKEKKRPEQPAPQPIGRGQGAAQCDWLLPPAQVNIPDQENPFGWLLALTPDQVDTLIRSLPGGLGFIAGPVLKFFTGILQKNTELFWQALKAFLGGNPCFQGENAALVINRALINLLGIFFGDALQQIKIPLVQNSNFLCPVQLPDAPAASSAWLRGVISEETWECWVRACGMRPEAWKLVTQSMRSKLTPDQLVRLAYRGAIAPADLPDRLRDLGFIDGRDSQELYELGRQIPGPSDLVRFMLRDVDDPNIVQRFGLDDEFGQKYQGLTRQWAEWQGLDEQTMGRYWRAHWSIPSPTQLYEMFHRLRNLPPGDPRRVDIEDVETALKQADILPYWIPKLLAVSFKRLRLVDIRRAFMDGTIDPVEVRRQYVEQGHTDSDADLLTRHIQRQKTISARKNPLVKAYAAGEMNFSELSAELNFQGYLPEDQDAALSAGRILIERARRKACSRSIRRRFITGELDKIDTQQALTNLGLDPDQAVQLSEAWACERASKGKAFSGSQLCKLFEQGLISGPDFVGRLERVGWDRDDAIKLFATCSNDLQRKRQLEDLKRIRQEQAEADKQERLKEKMANKLKQEAGDQLRRAENLRRINLAREKAIIDAGGSYSQRTGSDLSESVIHAKNIYRNVANLTTADRDTIVRALVISARNKQVEDPSTWQAETLAMANSGILPPTV